MALNRYLLVDGNNICFAEQTGRARLHAGEIETTAIFGLIKRLRIMALRFKTNKIIVLWDTSPTWRHEFFPTYKSNRDKNPQIVAAKNALKGQREYLGEVLRALGVQQFAAVGYEADDLGGHFSRGLAQKGAQSILITGDHDWLQLVSAEPTVAWQDPREDGKLISMVNFESETGYATPEQFLIGKCLQGDTSDCISGVGGLGKEAALALMRQFESIQDLSDRWSMTPGAKTSGTPLSRYRKKINDFLAVNSEGMALYQRNRLLMDLRNVQIDACSLQQIRGSYDPIALKQLFRQLAFHSLLADFDRWAAPFAPALELAA